MKTRPLTRSEIRAIDVQAAEQFRLPTLLLMENAGAAVASALRTRLSDSDRILLICGPGNNGGDGAVVARHLDGWGYSVQVAWAVAPEQIKGDAAVQQDILERSGIEQVWLSSTNLEQADWDANWLIDGLLGTGLTRPVEGFFRQVIERINRANRPVLAIDLPSGLDADTGKVQGSAVRASTTITFVGLKQGFEAPESHQYTGNVSVVDIGLPSSLLRPYWTGRDGSAKRASDNF